MTSATAATDTTDGRIVHGAIRLLGVLGAVLLFAMMTLTFVDVWGRYIFDAPVPGGFEVTELMMAALIFAGLPLATRNDEHVTVDLIDGIFVRAIARGRDFVIGLTCAVMMAVLSYRMWIKALEQVSYGDQTAVLQIPVAPIAFFMSVSCAFSALLFLVIAWGRLKRRPATA